MSGVVSACLVSFGAIFLAELGDKSQIMAMTFAGRYRTSTVLLGITISASLLHLVSVAAGHALGSAFATTWVTLAAAIVFVGVGLWTLRDASSGEDERPTGRGVHSPVVTVSIAFLLAELGDKTMVATITLATDHGWFGVWLGSTLGMVAADALAVLVGHLLARRLSQRLIRYGAAVLFFCFGGALFVEFLAARAGRTPGELVRALATQDAVAFWLGVLVLLAGALALLARVRLRMRRPARGPVSRASG